MRHRSLLMRGFIMAIFPIFFSCHEVHEEEQLPDKSNYIYWHEMTNLSYDDFHHSAPETGGHLLGPWCGINAEYHLSGKYEVFIGTYLDRNKSWRGSYKALGGSAQRAQLLKWAELQLAFYEVTVRKIKRELFNNQHIYDTNKKVERLMKRHFDVLNDHWNEFSGDNFEYENYNRLRKRVIRELLVYQDYSAEANNYAIDTPKYIPAIRKEANKLFQNEAYESALILSNKLLHHTVKMDSFYYHRAACHVPLKNPIKAILDYNKIEEDTQYYYRSQSQLLILYKQVGMKEELMQTREMLKDES